MTGVLRKTALFGQSAFEEESTRDAPQIRENATDPIKTISDPSNRLHYPKSTSDQDPTTTQSTELSQRDIFPFLELPLELRENIYQFCLPDSGRIKVLGVRSCIPLSHRPTEDNDYVNDSILLEDNIAAVKYPHPITTVCRQLRAESLPVIFSRCTVFAGSTNAGNWLFNNIDHECAFKIERFSLWFAHNNRHEHNPFQQDESFENLCDVLAKCKKLKHLRIYTYPTNLTVDDNARRIDLNLGGDPLAQTEMGRGLRRIKGLDSVHFRWLDINKWDYEIEDPSVYGTIRSGMAGHVAAHVATLQLRAIMTGVPMDEETNGNIEEWRRIAHVA